MRTKQATSVAFFLMILLLGQAMTSHLNQIPAGSKDSSLESTEPLFSSNNSTGNNSANDTDGDGINNSSDDCPNGTSNWTSSYYTDHDADGCEDASEDPDDDNDGLVDAFDSCPKGDLGWNSNNVTDYDSDGCRDWGEDADDDNDGVTDVDDSCSKGDLGWTSSASNDADGDGCRDSTEDTDGGGSNGGNNSANDSHCLTLDNFTINSTYFVGIDLVNICSKAIQYPGVNTSIDHSGVSGFTNQTNWFYMIGANGTYNLTWQLSFNQSVVNGTPIQLGFEAYVLNCGPNNSWSHACPNSTFSHQFIFVSSNTGGNNTNDTDGDGVANAYDSCPSGTSNWISTNSTDHDSDGCEDASEDLDDDNDGITDSDDSCPKGATGWMSSNSTDANGNGCRDSDEEPRVTIDSATNSIYNQSSSWIFNYSSTNYGGYIYWNATSEDGTLYSMWSSYVYSNGYQTSSQEEFYQSGNYTVCASIFTQTNGSNGSTMNVVDSECITISVYVAPVPVPCGNSSTLTFTNTSTEFNINDPIIFSVIVQCGPGESEFILRGDVSKYHGSQNWSTNTLEYFQYNSNGMNTPYQIAFELNSSNGSGDYIIQMYIGDAGNLIGYTQWNFTIYGDDDSDEVSDQIDNCPNVNNPTQFDLDNDGIGDACDLDLDGDGVANQNDAFPNNGNESVDTDGDAVGDNSDTDDDGDGMADSDDAFPLDPAEQADLDGDGVGDNLDADDDADGITDVTDNCPLVSNTNQADDDNDGVGTACDGMELGVDENGTITDGGDPIPSIGMTGTFAALSAGLFFAIRREDEE